MVAIITPGDGRSAASAPAIANLSDPVRTFAGQIVAAGAAVRLRTLLSGAPADALYRVADRQGLSVVVVPTTSLTDRERDALLAFRFAQYLSIGFVDADFAYRQQMRAEPPQVIAPGDLHVIAGIPATGELLGYAVVEQPPAAPTGVRLRASQRELFPVERVHGAGVYQRLPILPDLAVAKIREMGRFVRNQCPTAGNDLRIRAVVETGVALFRVMAGPLRLHVDAVVGDLEEHVAKQNLDFFHVPSVVVHGTVPYASTASYLYPRYQRHTVYPFACLTSDIESALPRLRQVEQALQRPGKLGMLSLMRLRGRGEPAPSLLCPAALDNPADEWDLPQARTSMPRRDDLIRQGAWLRDSAPFAGLSVAEAALLCAHMQPVRVPAGHYVARQGEPADAIYVVQHGEAVLRLTYSDGAVEPIATLGPGQCCGHTGVLTSGDHPVDVIATSDMTLLRLDKATHDAYLSRLPDVSGRLGQDALTLLARVNRQHRDHPAVMSEADCGCGPGCACLGHTHTTTDSAGPAQGDEPQ